MPSHEWCIIKPLIIIKHDDNEVIDNRDKDVL